MKIYIAGKIAVPGLIGGHVHIESSQLSPEAFAGLVKLDEQGYVVAGEDCATSCEGVFAAGDCRTKKVRQCATAVGDGATAAVNACAYIDSL